ncbi:hypothetical protein [Psychromonas sp. KJ10-2]|uniref:hypothetical protein n=1 Tax=Psychromonas sp. KJ10-2 TaxID=3391822 RepID=UPI0039B6D5A5
MEKGTAPQQEKTLPHSSRRFHFTKAKKDPLRKGLVLFCGLFDRQVTSSALADGYPLHDGKLAIDYVPRALARVGLSARVVDIELEDIFERLLPALLLTESGTTVILSELDLKQGTAKVLLPETGGGIDDLSLDELKEIYTGTAILAKPKFRKDDRAGNYAKEKKNIGLKGH